MAGRCGAIDLPSFALHLDVGMNQNVMFARREQFLQRLERSDAARGVLFAIATAQPDAADHLVVDHDRKAADKNREFAVEAPLNAERLVARKRWTVRYLVEQMGRALAMDYYRIEAFKTEADRDLACGSTAHEDVRYFPIGREELIGAGNEIESVGCGHTLDHPDFEQVFEPIFDAALRYLVGEMIQTAHPKNGPVATTVISIARVRYTITVVAAEDWFNFSVGGLCLFEQADPGLLERTGRYLEEQLILRLSPPAWNAKAN